MSRAYPPLPALQAFEAVCRKGSFAAAASELNVTRSAVSHRIAQLEATVGTRLLDRDAHSVMPTSAGAAYLLRVRQALAALDGIARPIPQRSRTETVTLTMPPTIARMVVLPRLAPFLLAHPEIEVAVELSQSQLDFRPDTQADIDIRFGTGHHPGRQSRRYSDDQVIAVAAPSYVERHNLRTPEDLVRASLIRSHLEPWGPWFEAAGLSGQGEPETGHRFEDLSLAYGAAAHGLGVALARMDLARDLLAGKDLVRVFDVCATSPHAYYILVDAATPRRPAVDALLDWLSEIQTGGAPISD